MGEVSQRIGTDADNSMPRTGRGSRPGEHRGGRKKGVPNRVTAEQRKAMQDSGLAPLDYLLSVVRDEDQSPLTRLDAAKAAAPYVHAKLSAIEHSGNAHKPVQIEVVTGVPR